MHIITGATGHVGSAVVKTLVARGEKVLALAHSLKNIPALKLAGADIALVNLHDVEQLTEIFSRGQTLFLLNPPGDPSKDSTRLERKSIECLLEALAASSIERIVAESTQGAQPGAQNGDLGTLYSLEQGLQQIGRPARITRAAYYFSNWDMQADRVRKTGVLQSFFPANFRLPMVSPRDLGEFNARQMLEPFTGLKIKNVSGPADYSPSDVATEFARVFHRDVRVEVTPQDKWIETYKAQGFSDISARSYAEMTRLTLEGTFERDPIRLNTTLTSYFDQEFGPTSLVRRLFAPLQL